MQTIFTTGDVARICKVAPRTVSKWFDSGRLRGYRVPGSQDRRIPRENLIRFLKEHGMPLGELEELPRKLLLVSTSTELRVSLNSDFEVATASDPFSAGVAFEGNKPTVVIIDDSIVDAQSIASRLSEYGIVLIALLGENDSLDPMLFTETFRKPFDIALLVERTKTLLKRKENLQLS